MAILEEWVEVGVFGRNMKYYEGKGYSIPRYKDKRGRVRVRKGTIIDVRTEDLHEGSVQEVTKICDDCGKHIEKQQYRVIIECRKSGRDQCRKCSARSVADSLKTEKLPYKNRLSTTHPEISQLLIKQSEAKYLSHGSRKRMDFICPKCNESVIDKEVANVVRQGLSCPRCSDGISYPEKFMFSLLTQLNIEFKTRKTFNWSKGREYDFYIPKINMIIETHGGQHYDNSFERIERARTLKEEVDNDQLKRHLAEKFAINHYIVVDCRYSNKSYIKNSVLNSRLNNFFNLSKVDWGLCDRHAINTSLVVEASKLWMKGIKNTLSIGKSLGVHRATALNYLKRGSELGLCNYCPKKAMESTYKKVAKRMGKVNAKKVVQLSKTNDFIRVWYSISEATRELSVNNISATCKGRLKSAGGYKWMYLEDYEKHIEIKEA